MVIHIGPRKTGTTYLQHRLRYARARLKRGGIICHLPQDEKRLKPGVITRTGLADLLHDGSIDEFAREVAEIRDQGWHCLLISSESLAKRTAAQIAVLAEVLKPDQVEIYAYCRRWSDRLPSHWWQLVATGGTTAFPDWFAASVEGGMTNTVINESLIWRAWAKNFGRDALHLISYDALRQEDIDIGDDFLRSRLHWDGKFRRPPPRTELRKSPSPLEVEVTRRLNVEATVIGNPLRGPRRRALLDRLRAVDFQPFRGMAGDVTQVLAINDADAAFAPAHQAMKAWEDRLVTRALSPDIVLPQTKGYRYVPPELLSTPEANAAFGDLLKSA